MKGKGENSPGLGQRKRKQNKEKLTNKVQSLVFLWPLCRVWNTTDLLCTCHRDMEAGREEEDIFFIYIHPSNRPECRRSSHFLC